MGVVALLTDFGTRDPWVGVMKGVVLGIHPAAVVVDLTHDVPPQDITRGARALATAVPYFPPRTVFVAVVDPGVGSARRPLAIRCHNGSVLVGPDNGLLAPAADVLGVELAVIPNRAAFHLPHPSSTFHGRDVFAPVAAHVARGVPLEALGPEAGALVRIPPPAVSVEGDSVHGRVVHVDAFGSLVTSIREAHMGLTRSDTARVEVAGRCITGVRGTFSDVPAGEPVAYVGSDGELEVALNLGNVARAWGVEVGAPVVFSRR